MGIIEHITEDKPHEYGECICRMCGHEGVSVWPVDVVVGRKNMECPNCSNMTYGPKGDNHDDVA